MNQQPCTAKGIGHGGVPEICDGHVTSEVYQEELEVYGEGRSSRIYSILMRQNRWGSSRPAIQSHHRTATGGEYFVDCGLFSHIFSKRVKKYIVTNRIPLPLFISFLLPSQKWPKSHYWGWVTIGGVYGMFVTESFSVSIAILHLRKSTSCLLHQIDGLRP